MLLLFCWRHALKLRSCIYLYISLLILFKENQSGHPFWMLKPQKKLYRVTNRNLVIYFAFFLKKTKLNNMLHTEYVLFMLQAMARLERHINCHWITVTVSLISLPFMALHCVTHCPRLLLIFIASLQLAFAGD